MALINRSNHKAMPSKYRTYYGKSYFYNSLLENYAHCAPKFGFTIPHPIFSWREMISMPNFEMQSI